MIKLFDFFLSLSERRTQRKGTCAGGADHSIFVILFAENVIVSKTGNKTVQQTNTFFKEVV
jgi:hypothetical protein